MGWEGLFGGHSNSSVDNRSQVWLWLEGGREGYFSGGGQNLFRFVKTWREHGGAVTGGVN
jgi:hypothetical protein